VPDREVQQGEEAATVAEPIRRRSRPTIPPPLRAAGTDGSTPATSLSAREADAIAFTMTLRNAEIARTRRVVPFVFLLAVCGAMLVPFAGGDLLAREIVYGGIVVGIAAIGYLYWLAGDAERFVERRVALAYGVSIVAVFTAVYYWGIFSPVAAIVALAIFFVALGRSLRVGLMLYVLSAVLQGALAIVVIDGLVRDRGLVTSTDTSVQQQIIQQVMLQIVYAVTYLIARATRLQLDRAVGDHDAAVRAVAQREALLVEARQDLDQALKIGDAGRYTDQIVGSYRLGAVIGRGAMGDVYEAVHAETGTPAAVKLLRPGMLGATGRLARFYREAEAVAKLRSPHIVQLFEVNAAEHALPYMAMERLHGHDLAQMLRERRRLPADEVAELVAAIAQGLEAARQAGIVHRDIKPQNLFLDERGGSPLWKILDFGVSKLADHQGTLTKDHVVGTPVYMAPEQARGLPVDHRADAYALATVAYRAITGQPPFGGRDVPTILYNVVHTHPARASSLVPKLPRDVDRALAIGMAKDPADRFATALELAEALTAAASNKLARDIRDRGDALLALQ
jgi:eukaryotic-like serine/threonine-protein kinase